MALLAAVVSVAASIVLTPFLMFILCIIFLASIGKSLGVRRLYVNLLLRIFEYGRQHIEVAKMIKRPDDYEIEDDELEPGGSGDKLLDADRPPSAALANGHANGSNGMGATKASVIKREDLILAPDPGLNYKRTASQERLGSRSASSAMLLAAERGEGVTATSVTAVDVTVNGNGKIPMGNGDAIDAKDGDEQLVSTTPPNGTIAPVTNGSETMDFDLSKCLEYVKAGMESIIEDQVTSVFEAEELRSWNLLTRTNSHYEFISWRLSIIWFMGFVVRYFFLLPLRILICFIGLVHLIVVLALVGLLPRSAIKRSLSETAYKTSFRILARCLSVVLTFHNSHYRPRKGGFCVANHTSPIDVMILSTETNFSLVWWLTFCMAAVGYIPEGPFKRSANRIVSVMCFETLSRSLSAVITYHNCENRPKRGICVANHTSPIDVLVLMCDNCYSLIGQSHGGFLGLLQRALARASPHIWFERSEAKDRNAVARRLKEHVSDPNNPPILIFPEGTCINNTSVMQFKKGSFEVGGVIYPVAIKYDPRFGDAFWNSSRYGMLHYLYMMMSSWAIVCDVWYLPPMYRRPDETAIDFASRVKSVIARQGGLVDLMWDGQLKRMKPKKEWKELQQEEFSKRLKGE